jgi:cobalt-zinc-cadmium efflux system protein
MNPHHDHKVSKKHLGITIGVNAVIFVVELLGGIFTNSLALISDAIHNLSDFIALILSYIAASVVTRNSNHKKTYGYVRVEILVAFINSLTLVIIGFFIIYEAIKRIGNPEPVLGLWMLIIAGIGFLANAFSTLLLKKDAEHDLNAKSAYLHLFTDAIESLAVIVVGATIYFSGWYFLDPVISIAIGAFIIKSAWDILVETVNILTEGTPKGIDINEIATMISSFPEVESVHHIHVWSLSSQFRALSAHVVVKDRLISSSSQLIRRLNDELEERFNINHPTLQLETDVCPEQNVIVNINDLSE